jgi:hypothetical protein
MRSKSIPGISMIGVAAVFVVGGVLPMWAHHSHGNYEDTFMDIEGVVQEVHLVVPHSWVYIEVKDAKEGEPQIWSPRSKVRTASWGLSPSAAQSETSNSPLRHCRATS